MPIYLNTPPAITGNEKEQLNQLRSYVFQTVEALNVGMRDMGAEGVLEEISRAVSEEGGLEEDKGLLAVHNNIRSLIIKTADFAVSNSEEFKKLIKSEYSAASDFGELTERLENEITANAEGITQLYRYTSGIRSDFGDFSTESEQYIKTGLLYMDENGAPVYGVGIGNLSTTIDANGERVLDKQNLLTTTTAEEIAFWNGGEKIAYINGNMMYFPSGTLKAYEADISGKITATSGEIGGCSIVNGVLKVGNANIENIDAGKITTGTLSSRNIVFDSLVSIMGRDGASKPFEEKGIFGYETEGFENAARGLLLESGDGDRSLFLAPSNTWLVDNSNGTTKMLRFKQYGADFVYDEDYKNETSGYYSAVRLTDGYAVMEYRDRGGVDKLISIRVQDDDIRFRISSGTYYLSEIIQACGL